MENSKDNINGSVEKQNDERAKENERLADKNKDIMVCWCCEHFVLREKTLEGGCILKWKIVPAFQIVCPEFVLNGGIFTKRKIPDYCVNYENKENENE